MGLQVFPVPSVSTEDEYELIATNTPTSGTTSDFTSIAGYKKLLLTYKIDLVSSGMARMRFNSDTGNNYVTNLGRDRDRIDLFGTNTDGQIRSGFVIIENVLKAFPKFVTGAQSVTNVAIIGAYFESAAITSVNVFTSVNFNSSNNELKLYGVPA